MSRREAAEPISLKKRVKKQLALLPGYIPLLIWLAFLVATVGWIVLASLSKTSEIYTDSILKSGFHFENYAKAWNTNNVAQYFLNSVICSLTACAAVVLIAAPASYILGHKIFKGRNTLINAFLISMSIPTVMIVIPMFSILVKMNLVGKLSTLIVLYIAANVPYTVYFLTSFFGSIPSALEEAALIDGCSQYKAFWKIILPMAQPGIITVTIFNFMNMWNEYFMALIFANSSDSTRTLAVGLQNMINAMKYSGDWAGLFASVIIVFLPTFILYLFLSDKIISGITGGAVKG